MTRARKKAITGLIGYPVDHSLSPVIHNYWIKKYNINAEYKLFTTEPRRLRQTILHMRKKNILGVNITVPHKQAVTKFLDALDDNACRVGAVNTIINRDDSFIGSNTDAYGFTGGLTQQLGKIATYLEKVVVLGAGGATRAVVVALKDAGAKEIIITNRTAENARLLAAEFGARAVAWEAREAVLDGATLLVNTTSLGMQKKQPLTLKLDRLPKTAAVCDIVYAPLETDLLKRARARGNPTADGLGMLLYQAQLAFKEWHGVMPEVTMELRKLVMEKQA